MRDLKICFIAGTLGMGGAERQLYFILKTLKENGADISLICLTKDEYWESHILGLNINYISFFGKGGKVLRMLRIISILRRLKPQIVQSQHFFTNIYAAVGAKFCNAKSIGASRSELNVEINANGIFGRFCFRLPDYLAPNSQKSIEQAIKLGRKADTLFYLPNALDLSKFSASKQRIYDEKEPIVFLAIGRLIKLKRFDKFILLLSNLKEKYGDRIKGQLIGDGLLADELLAMADQYQLLGNTLEFIPRTSTPEINMQRANFLVLTSDYEGNPNVVIEAMACGLPVISTKVGNVPYFMQDGVNGYFFDGTVKNLTERVTSLLVNRKDMNMLSAQSRKTAENMFSMEALRKNLNDLYLTIQQS